MLKTFQVYKAFPDIKANAFGFTIDPLDCRRVWFFIRATGTNTGPLGFSFGLQIPPSGKVRVCVLASATVCTFVCLSD